MRSNQEEPMSTFQTTVGVMGMRRGKTSESIFIVFKLIYISAMRALSLQTISPNIHGYCCQYTLKSFGKPIKRYQIVKLITNETLVEIIISRYYQIEGQSNQKQLMRIGSS